MILKILALAAVICSLSPAQPAKPEAGIPINDQLTISKCGGCHQRDGSGMMRRISYIRTTPEVWEEAIKRMVRLNGLAIQPEEARLILRYLSANNGLSPDEAKPIFWEAEHRLFRDQSDKIPADALQHTCNYCHTIGRVLGQRRTHDDYEKLISMHIGLFPGAENTLRPRRPGGTPEDTPIAFAAQAGGLGLPSVIPPTAPSKQNQDPADVAVDYLSKAQPLTTPEWSEWKAAMREPKLAGKWLLTGYQQGRGRVFGTVTVQAGSSPDDFTTTTELEYATSGVTLTRTGKSVVYTGYSWRGRSTGEAGKTASTDPGSSPKEWREALFVSRDGNTMDGRWFWGGYQEFGIDAHLTRLGDQVKLAGASVFALQSPSTKSLKLYGANFPSGLKAADVDLGSGIRVTKILGRTPTAVEVEIQTAANLPNGIRDISVGRSTAERAIAIYDKVSYIKVLPDASMGRLGGTIAAKQYAQFEAVAYAAGADGKPHTADDIPLGPVAARWGMEEFVSTPGDDDMNFVGKLNDNGLFTPNLEGPNPERKKASNNFPTNNWGDVWVTANYQSPSGEQMKAKSYLVVTIPVYVRWDQPEVGQ